MPPDAMGTDDHTEDPDRFVLDMLLSASGPLPDPLSDAPPNDLERALLDRLNVDSENSLVLRVLRTGHDAGRASTVGQRVAAVKEHHGPAAATVRDAALELIRKGYADPGAAVPREFDQGPEKDETEPVWAWGARAALENLVNAELLSGVTPAAAVVPQEQYDDLEAEYVNLLVPVAKLLGVPAAIPDPNPGENGSEDAPQVWNLDGIQEALERAAGLVERSGGES